MAKSKDVREMSVSELKKAYSQKSALLVKLLKKRGKLQRQLLGVDEQISTLRGDDSGDGVVKTVRKRLPNTQSLRLFILDELKRVKSGLELAPLTDNIKKLGFRSRATNFSLIVYQGLYQLMKKKVVTVKNGVYQLS